MNRFSNSLEVMAVAAAMMGSVAHSIEVTPSTSASTLATALVGGGGSGVIVTGSSLDANSGGGNGPSSGTYSNASGTYGIGPGIILSTGQAAHYGDGPNTVTNKTTAYNPSANAAQEALLDPITGGSYHHRDPTQFDMTFNMLPGYASVTFSVVFGSEEFGNRVGTSFVDGFGLYLNGVNIAFVGGLPVTINHPGFAAMAGTELDGVLKSGGSPVLLFAGPVSPTGNTVTFIIADASDANVDSTVYISLLSGAAQPPPTTAIPEPSTLGFAGIGLAVGLLLHWHLKK